MACSSTNFNSSSPSHVTSWQLRTRTLTFGDRPLLMGIVNVTPDSFSDGGEFFDAKRAIDHALRLASEGAEILDIGGESTRPYSQPVDVEEELRRVLPVVEGLKGTTDAAISVDTSKAEVARAALFTGAEIINDVTGLEGDPDMLPLAVEAQAAVCVMHMQGTPQTMQDAPHYDDIVGEVCQYLARRRDALLEAGIPQERICLDPGFGFGKTQQHNLELISHCWKLHRLGCPILAGHSRKGFLAKLLPDRGTDRTFATIGASLALAQQGVQVLRIHDVREVREALKVFFATGGGVCYDSASPETLP